MQLTNEVRGNGFDISVRNISRNHAMFTVYEAESKRFARVYANVSDSSISTHLGFVYQRTENYIAVYVNGIEAGRASLIEAIESRTFEFGTDRVLVFGQDICPIGEITPYKLKDLRLWRYPLRSSVIFNLYGSGKNF